MTRPLRDQVFISYSHEDRAWLKRLRKLLSPLVREGMVDPWDDSRIRPGQKWQEKIDRALARAKVAVLLVSDDFLASDFIHHNELPRLLDAQKTHGLTVLWVLLRACHYDVTPIKDYQAVHDPGRPLKTLPKAEQHELLYRLSREIRDAVARVQPQPLDGARLRFSKAGAVGLTRVFARPVVSLGRPRCRANLWLFLYPLDDPRQHRLMDAFSEFHAELCLAGGPAVRDCDHVRV